MRLVPLLTRTIWRGRKNVPLQCHDLRQIEGPFWGKKTKGRESERQSEKITDAKRCHESLSACPDCLFNEPFLLVDSNEALYALKHNKMASRYSLIQIIFHLMHWCNFLVRIFVDTANNARIASWHGFILTQNSTTYFSKALSLSLSLCSSASSAASRLAKRQGERK